MKRRRFPPLTLIFHLICGQIEAQRGRGSFHEMTPVPFGSTGLVPIKSCFSELDKWVRRRLRCCYWKQWRRPCTRIAKLRRLGIREHEAVTHGVSSKGPWVMSASQAVHEALSVDYLAAAGLVSLLDLWSTLAPWKRIA